MGSTLWAVLVLALSALAGPNPSPYRLHEKRVMSPPGGFTPVGTLPMLSFLICFALSQSNIDEIWDIPHGAGDILRKFSPGDETITTLPSIKVTPNRGWIEVHATVEEAERLLQTEYHVYGHETSQEHVVHFDSKIVKRSGCAEEGGTVRSIGQSDSGTSPKSTDYASCLRVLYGLVHEPLAADNNSPRHRRISKSDLDMFASKFSKDLVGDHPRSWCRLMEYGMNLVTSKQKVTLYRSGDMTKVDLTVSLRPSANICLVLIRGAMIRYDHLPTSLAILAQKLVVPSSPQTGSWFFLHHYVNVLSMPKLGLMGVTVLYSSGDYGVAGSNGQHSIQKGHHLQLHFPFDVSIHHLRWGNTSEPWFFRLWLWSDASRSFIREVDSATYFAMPEYQKEAVADYLKNHCPQYPSSIWNSTETVNGSFVSVFGTSCSSPVSGAIFTMINDARLAIGKKPIGFINPTIYSANFTGAFHDITKDVELLDIPAVPGWDPVTGLGTLNFPELVAKWLTLPMGNSRQVDTKTMLAYA
ncbi:peptidase S8/S53 domain-containing protein [Melanogaster broomeanus]|nr:peptidase S8/S53 domain-containing protein [Melanogaster broomeanus]